MYLAKSCFCSAIAATAASALVIMSCNAFAHECYSFGALSVECLKLSVLSIC